MAKWISLPSFKRHINQTYLPARIKDFNTNLYTINNHDIGFHCKNIGVDEEMTKGEIRWCILYEWILFILEVFIYILCVV
jgi:hypothetical protein